MISLTKNQEKLYGQEIERYNTGYFKCMSLQAYLNARLEKLAFYDKAKHLELYAIAKFAENDF